MKVAFISLYEGYKPSKIEIYKLFSYADIISSTGQLIGVSLEK